MTMATQPNLFENFLPFSQPAYFGRQFLSTLFHSKISRSQATGKDGVRVAQFLPNLTEECAIIERKVGNGTYRFTTFKERLLLRGSDREPRQISIPTLRDRLALRALCQLLHTVEPASVGYSPHTVVDQVVSAIREGDQTRTFVRIDVRNFFPSIIHERLRSALVRHGIEPVPLDVAMKAVATATGASAGANARGIPQGLSISGALAAIYLLDFDRRQADRFPSYFRYVDDILCIVPADEARSTLRQVSRSLNSIGLTVHAEGVAGKTELKPISAGIDFLGYSISNECVSVKDASYRRMFKNILKVLTDFRYRRSAERTKFRLNLKITGCIVDGKRRGWLMFFSRTENMSQLAYLDRFIAQQLQRIGFPRQDRSDIKAFIKSFHEMRFNLAGTNYIPNFDTYTNDQKASTVSALLGKELAEVQAWDFQQIENEFSRLVSKEIHDLEQDVGTFS